MLDDTPHSIALGAAIGMFIALMPVVGIQMLIVGIVALLTRRLFYFNRIAALIMVYVTNPLTIVPIYWFCYRVGAIWFPVDVTRDDFAKLLEYEGFSQWWDTIANLFIEIGVPLLVGTTIVGIVCGIATYPTIRWLIKKVVHEKHGTSPAPATTTETSQAPALATTQAATPDHVDKAPASATDTPRITPVAVSSTPSDQHIERPAC